MKDAVGVKRLGTSHARVTGINKCLRGCVSMTEISTTRGVAVLLVFLCSSVFGQSFVPGTCIFVPAATVSGVVPNALPFTETFDQYPVSYWFNPPTNGWLQDVGDASHTVSATTLPVTPGGAAQFSGNCLSLETEGQTLYNVTTGHAQNVWIDLSVLMVPCEDLPEFFPETTQLGLLLDWNNRFMVYCGLTNQFIDSGIQFATGGQKVHLTLQIANAGSLQIPYFRVFVDQTNVVWGAGYSLPGVPSSGDGGAWLPCATTNRMFCGLGFLGSGAVDSLTFSEAYLGPDDPHQTMIAQAVAISWLSDYGRIYQVESCENLSGGLWQPFGAPVLGDGKTNTVFDAVGSVSRKFYRVMPL